MMGGSGQGGSGRAMMMQMMMGGRGGVGNMPRTVAPSGMMGMVPGGTGASQTKVQEREDENLVEMTVYGIATLYRRLDPPKTEAQPGQPATPAPAPAGTAK